MENTHYLITMYFFFRAIVGELDDEMDARLDLSTIRADPLSSIIHWRMYPKLQLESSPILVQI